MRGGVALRTGRVTAGTILRSVAPGRNSAGPEGDAMILVSMRRGGEGAAASAGFSEAAAIRSAPDGRFGRSGSDLALAGLRDRRGSGFLLFRRLDSVRERPRFRARERRLWRPSRRPAALLPRAARFRPLRPPTARLLLPRRAPSLRLLPGPSARPPPAPCCSASPRAFASAASRRRRCSAARRMFSSACRRRSRARRPPLLQAKPVPDLPGVAVPDRRRDGPDPQTEIRLKNAEELARLHPDLFGEVADPDGGRHELSDPRLRRGFSCPRRPIVARRTRPVIPGPVAPRGAAASLVGTARGETLSSRGSRREERESRGPLLGRTPTAGTAPGRTTTAGTAPVPPHVSSGSRPLSHDFDRKAQQLGREADILTTFAQGAGQLGLGHRDQQPTVLTQPP